MNSFDEDAIESEVNLPAREFLFSLDQIAQMLDVSMKYLTGNIIFFYGRSIGSRKGKLLSVNIAAPGDNPVWRVAEMEFKSWMRYRKIRFTEQRNVRMKGR
ncbi:helix-turn-helix DNA binding domain protein [Gordonia phage Amore2]|uniref:Uncharacterized protein n=2 Tax=Getseptimavirus TaxID=2560139 RepID=A0A0K0N764_9CAUD|nr:hypothetical protein GTE7_gp053 [Gordonia phage GTE7]YP_009189191.1 hypothetical protein AU104_gp064 [Gordonia phage GMA7]QSL99704.1 helix-turn-helix DNA binding protein [Gordonia phage Austin]USH44880.1 helix-turn-helix DNA binding domain protein [Gordonia phage Amore2]AER26596.1 hypothetical protein [Gordonia phage GTE7]AKJ72491.1 hypothetical protein GMA7_54 [Gordonia phage GMA7]